MLKVIRKTVYVCEDNYNNTGIIGICTDENKAIEIVKLFFEKTFDASKLELKCIGSNGVYSFSVVGVVKNFAEINPIELNERLF